MDKNNKNREKDPPNSLRKNPKQPLAADSIFILLLPI